MIYNVPKLNLSYKKGKKITIDNVSNILNRDNAYIVLKKLFNKDLIEYQEQFITLYLDTKANIIGYINISSGGFNASIIEAQMILAPAILSNTKNIIVAHNHPSGDLTPSKADIDLTDKLRNACEFFNIQLLDHFILSNDHYKAIK
jgi:DNA repair protein RadC